MYSICCFLLLIMLIEKAIFVEEITEEFQKELAKKYNDVRSRYARGEVPGFTSVPNMMEASWSQEAAKFAEKVLKQLCEIGKYDVLDNNYHFLVSTSKKKNDTIEIWADAFYRDPERNDNKSIQQTIRPEVTEVGCSVGFCRNVSYALCAHGKIIISTNSTIVYDTGIPCSKCPTDSKCTLDGLCSLRKNATNSTTRIPVEHQWGFVRYLNMARTKIAIENQGFPYNDKEEYDGVQFPSAGKMMEVKWSDEAAIVAESAMLEYCKNGTTNYNRGKYQLAAYDHFAQYYDIWTAESLFPIFFTLSNVAYPLFLTPEFVKSEKYSEFSSWTRRQIVSTRDDITEIGCSMEYCRGDAVVICAFGEITCLSNCSLYQNGTVCTMCPTGSKCTFDKLCSFREEATTNFTKLSKPNREKILDTINKSRSNIAKGKHQIRIDQQGERVNRTLPEATNMREVVWNQYARGYAETKIIEFCKYPNLMQFEYEEKTAIWLIPVGFEKSSRNNSEYWDIPVEKYFKPSVKEWPQSMTIEEQKSEMFTNLLGWERFDMLLSWASFSYIGCAMEYCRGQIILLCSVGSFDCFRKCRLYQNGTTCSNCPKNTECAKNGLCRELKPVTSTVLPPLDDDEKEQVVEASLKTSTKSSFVDCIVIFIAIFIL